MADSNENGRPDVFDRIRARCRAVAATADHVRIHGDRIDGYAATLSLDRPALPSIDAESHFLGDEAETVAYFVTLAAINFGSGYFPHLRKRPRMSGYYTIAASLADRFRADGPIPAAGLRATTPRDCAQLFGQDMAHFPIRELMTLLARALGHLGGHVESRYDGQFDRLIEAADRSAARLVELLTAQPFFRDVPTYREISVPFYKRAQLLASDLALAFDGQGPGRFDDLDRLTIFADNLVPHVLRVDGLLEYSEALAATIDRDEPIRAGSDEEVEIRACAVDCVERIRDALARSGRCVPARDLDQLLWHRGQSPVYKVVKRHRTRTVFY